MKSFMLACLNYYIDSYKMFDNVILITATFLDPELKNFDLFDEYTDKSSADFVSIATEDLVKKHDSLKFGVPEKEYVDPETASSKESNKSSNKALSVEQELYLFLRPNRVSVARKSKFQTIHDEIKTYKSLKIEKSDFSLFWSNNSSRLPKLATLVKFFCCGKATSSPSERDFNMGTYIITPKRNSISNKNVEYLTFLRRNLERNFK